MSLSQNIKRFRTERNLTQEQLAEALGVSAQAVSKCETSETYPDGSLLVPLAQKLGVSLDELFGNTAVPMADLARRIASMLSSVPASHEFRLVRDLCWQMEKGLFNRRMAIDMTYRLYEAEEEENSSYILDENGFTLVSNSDTPFFAVFPQTEAGYGGYLQAKEPLQRIFSALAYPRVMEAVQYLFRHDRTYVFESEVLARDCGISPEEVGEVVERLRCLGLVFPRSVDVNGKERLLLQNRPSHKLLALLVVGRELCYDGFYNYQTNHRSSPFLK